MDPFEVRLEFLDLLRKLNATQQSIQSVVKYAQRNFASCGEDLWDCILEECSRGSINNRINILYFLDSLFEACLQPSKSHRGTPSSSAPSKSYVDFAAQDVAKIAQSVVPEGRQGLPNLTSTKQVLESWRAKRILDPQVIDAAVAALDARPAPDHSDPSTGAPNEVHLSKHEVFKRIEEDRERHKRLRERRWVQPVIRQAGAPLACWRDGEDAFALDVEFENEWENTSDWNEDDDEAAREEVRLYLSGAGGEGDEARMDVDT